MRLLISGGFLCVLNCSVWDLDNFHFQLALLCQSTQWFNFNRQTEPLWLIFYWFIKYHSKVWLETNLYTLKGKAVAVSAIKYSIFTFLCYLERLLMLPLLKLRYRQCGNYVVWWKNTVLGLEDIVLILPLASSGTFDKSYELSGLQFLLF